MKAKIYRQLKNACLYVFFALWSISNMQALESSNGWAFNVKADGTAALLYPVSEKWGSSWSSYWNSNISVFQGYTYHIVSNLTIPSSVTVQTWSADPHGIWSVAYGKTYTVTEIDNGMSSDQRAAVTSVSIPETLTTIGNSAFSRFTKLPGITIPSSVTFIDRFAFENDSSLLSISLPASITTMNDNAFHNCTSLQSATVLNSTIGPSQFLNCTALKDVTISSNVTTIGNSAFYNCSSVETLTIPASVTSCSSAFGGMTGLKTLNFYAKNVPANTFTGLPFENLDLTGAVTIANSAFSKCTKLKTAKLSESLTSIDRFAFENDSSLLSISLPASITTINDNVFHNCTSLQSATVLNSTIGSSQFANCTSLKDVTISSSVTTIGASAFYNCTALQDVTVAWATPLSVSTSIFSGVNTKAATLHVPAGTTALYQIAPVWKDFGNIVETAAPVTLILSASPSSLSFAASGEQKTFSITSNTNWTVGSSDAWLTVSPASGSNDGMVTVTAAANTSTAQRTATITVSGGTEVASQTIDVTQETIVQNLDLDAVNNAQALIEAATYTVQQVTANTEETVKAWLVEQMNVLPGMSDTGITVAANDITLDSFTSAVTNISDGSFTFTVSLSKGSSQTTASKSGAILHDLTYTITGVPETVTIGTPINLSGYDPNYQRIDWTIEDAGTTDPDNSMETSYSYVNGLLEPLISLTITPKAAGTLIVKANVYALDKSKTDVLLFSQDFTINVVAAPAYSLSIGTFTGGSVTSDKAAYDEGDNVALNILPDDGYQLDSVVAYKTDDPATEVTLDGADNARSFTMPAFDVTVTATFKEIPAIVPPDPTTIGDDGNGIISLNLTIPGNAILIGSFEITFPEGMALDEQLTVLSLELSGNFSLLFTFEGNNTWLIEIKSNTLRSSTVSEFTKIMDIAFIVNSDVPKGNYEATLRNLDFMLDDNTSINQDLITAPINVERVATSIENIDNSLFFACFINNTLRIESPNAELISIYSITGKLLYAGKKNEGAIEIPFTTTQGIYIIKGSVSGTIKTVK